MRTVKIPESTVLQLMQAYHVIHRFNTLHNYFNAGDLDTINEKILSISKCPQDHNNMAGISFYTCESIHRLATTCLSSIVEHCAHLELIGSVALIKEVFSTENLKTMEVFG